MYSGSCHELEADLNRFARFAGALALGLLATACGGGGGGGGGSGPAAPWWESYGPGLDLPADDDDAARFLTQATFGPHSSDIEGLGYAGFDAWFDYQTGLPPTLHRPKLEQKSKQATHNQRNERWWLVAVTSPDQLRQRVAFALSEIFVISDRSDALFDKAVSMAEYYDILVRNALGDWRQLLEEVTLSPAMGVYLSMLGNQKPEPLLNIRPDENYAREVLQLFSIGLVKLNPDGTPTLDIFGDPIPTYDQAVVEGFAHVFTGWNYANASNWYGPKPNYKPMEPWASFHDTGPKLLLDGFVAPGGQTAEADLELALDVIFAHQNVGPFVVRQLIQRLVTSNPTPAYIGRVTAVFEDDGTGTRGNLGAVVKALLLDPEARNGSVLFPDSFGKLKEPILRQTALWRAFEAEPPNGPYEEWYTDYYFNQAPLRSPSVFNFFYPDWQPPGELDALGLVAPEFQITTHHFATRGTNRLFELVYVFWEGSPWAYGSTARLDLSEPRALATDPVALVDWLDQRLAGGGLSQPVTDIIVNWIAALPLVDGIGPDGTLRVLEATFLVITSPEAAVQR